MKTVYNFNSKEFSIDKLKDLKKRSKKGDAESQYLLANYYDEGLSIDNQIVLTINSKKAFELIKCAFKNGSSDALIAYANYQSTGTTYCKRDEKLAIKLYKQAIDKKDSLGAFNLAKLYSRAGRYKKAFKNYLLTERLGGYFFYEIATSYYFGLGTKQDIPKAVQYFKRLIEDKFYHSDYEFEEANFILGKLYLEGIHVKKSLKNALRYLKTANKENSHRSALDILQMLT